MSVKTLLDTGGLTLAPELRMYLLSVRAKKFDTSLSRKNDFKLCYREYKENAWSEMCTCTMNELLRKCVFSSTVLCLYRVSF